MRTAKPVPQPIEPPPALPAWVERYGGELRRHLERMLGSPDDAEDALQQVWLAAHRRPPDAGAGSNPRAWLYRVATNAALDRLAADRRRRASLEGLPADLGPASPAAPDEDLHRLTESARARVRERCARLPRKQREAVWLRWVEGQDYVAIAHRLGTSREAARANVYQGMKRLRAELFDVWKEVEA